MGINSVPFQSAGQRTEHLIPGVFSRSAYIREVGGGAPANRAVLIGEAKGGEPNVLYFFTSPSEAREVLAGGPLLESVLAAFDPGNDLVPQRIGAMRTNPGTQAQRQLSASSTAVILAKSAIYGLHANQLKMKLEAGTASGSKKITVDWKGSQIVKDNIVRPSFQIQYTGSGSAAVMSITKTQITTTVTGATGDNLSVAFSSFATIDDVVNYINDTGKYSCVVKTTDGRQLSTHLDSATDVAIKASAVIAYSNLQAIIDTLNSIAFIGSAAFIDAAGARTVPDNDTAFIYFSGGTHGSSTVTEYTATLTALEALDVSIIGTSSTDAAVHALIKAHCVFMSSTVNRRERTFVVGGAAGETVAQAIERAQSLNSKYGSLAYPGCIGYDFDDPSKTKTFAPSIYAAKLLGMEAAMAVNEPWTNKAVSVLGWEKNLTMTEVESLISAGVAVGGRSQDNRLVTVRAMTTYQGSDLQLCERSMVREDLYMGRDLREALSGGIGSVNALSDSSILATLGIKSSQWLAQGLIVKGDKPSGVWGATIRRSGDAVYLEYHSYLAAPTNFVFATANQHVYSSSLTSIQL